MSSLWESILKSATTNPVTPTADLFILGPNPSAQTILIKKLQTGLKSTKIANSLALGYSYVDFKDQSEFLISHLDIHTLDLPDQYNHDTHSTLLKHALTKSRTQGHRILVIIGLDWSEKDIVQSWTSQLALWVGIIKQIAKDMDLDEVNRDLSRRLQTYVSGGENAATSAHHLSKDVFNNIEIPLDEGQFDSPLGVDLAIVTIGSECITNQFEGTADDVVDLIQQLLRAVALKHGGSLIYIPSKTPSSTEHPPEPSSATSTMSATDTVHPLVSLISERLQLPVKSSIPEKCTVSVVEQTQICIPAGWDSKGKILALRDGFPYADLTKLWDDEPSKVLPLIESLIPVDYSYMNGPSVDSTYTLLKEPIHIPRPDFQAILAEQYEVLQKINADAPKNSKDLARGPLASIHDMNVSGIQVERVEEVFRRLKAREQTISKPEDSPAASPLRALPAEISASPGSENERLASFFQGLLDRSKKTST